MTQLPSMNCPVCEAEFQASVSQYGSEMTCPTCETKFQLPKSPPVKPEPWFQEGTADVQLREHDIKMFARRKIPAGVCGILLGGWGVHKFILGFHREGVYMFIAWWFSLLGLALLQLASVVFLISLTVIGIVEGIIYLRCSDEQFYHRYAIARKKWR